MIEQKKTNLISNSETSIKCAIERLHKEIAELQSLVENVECALNPVLSNEGDPEVCGMEGIPCSCSLQSEIINAGGRINSVNIRIVSMLKRCQL